MRVFRTLIGTVTAVLAAATAGADLDPDFSYEIPAYIKTISNAQGLTQYLNSKSSLERITACIRLGEIGGDHAIDLLVDAFEKEPHGSAAEAVKFQALTSIGKIGGPRAEALLKEIARDHSKNINDSTQVFGLQDSLAALTGALEGLYLIGSSSAEAFIDSTFNNETYYWFVRYLAYIKLIEFNLKSESFEGPTDSAMYLISELAKICPGSDMWNQDGSINVSFIKSAAFKQLIFRYKDTTLPALYEYISTLNQSDPAVPCLDSLRMSIEGKPLK